jgi:ATP-dependent DNA helicase 2 subunit 2
LGDAGKFPDTSLRLEVERYPKIMPVKAPSAKQVVVKTEGSSDGAGPSAPPATKLEGEESAAAAVKRALSYSVADAGAPGGKRTVDGDQLERGYEYGRTAVNVSKEDMEVATIPTWQSLDIVGFVSAKSVSGVLSKHDLTAKFDRYMEMTKTSVIIAARGDRRYTMALSSLIHALHDGQQYAVARFVVKTNKPPVLLLLAPLMEDDFECLVDAELPFTEDVRNFKFPPLDKVITVSGKQVTKHRTMPTDNLKEAVSQYVDSMDLSSAGKDENGYHLFAIRPLLTM